MPDDQPKGPTLGTAETAEKFEEKMQEIRIKEREEETKRTAAGLGVPYISLVGFPISPEAIGSIPKPQAATLKVLCFLNTGAEIRVGAVDPQRPELKELLFQLEERFRGKTGLYIISEHSFEEGFKLYDIIPEIRKIVKGVEITETELARLQKEVATPAELNEKIQRAPITDVVTMIIASSLASRSSDIHIEAEEKEIIVRFRIDGELAPVAALPHALWSQIISRIKLISSLKINVTDRPQDGRFTIQFAGEKVEVRVSALPTSYGESVVMRLLRAGAIELKFEALGIRGHAFEQLKREVERPHGMIITTGPTGSGKTTTLYAMLAKLNTPGVKIITLEDPVEYKLQGVNQSQIDHSKEYTFAKGLRSILRQDPDVVMVGEIRDLETAEIAIQAALTGHLVLSTIHTNDAAGAIPRFLSMAVKPFLLAPALNAIVGQRLVRRIHEDCKEELILDAAVMERVKKVLSEIPPESGVAMPPLGQLKFFRGKGCAACNDTGFKGRIGIYEVLPMGPEVEKAILSEKASEFEMREIAKRAGMVTMAQDGLLKALDGITTVEEVFKVAE
ncbi:MAG: GspE/PulE family protein [Patescibacteria group bacterium]